MKPLVTQFAHTAPVRSQPICDIDGTISRQRNQGRFIARCKEISTLVVGEEEFAGMDAGRRGMSTATRRGWIGRHARRDGRMVRQQIVPARVAGHCGEQQDLFQLAQGQWRVLRSVGQRAIRQRCPQRKTPRAATGKGVKQREFGQRLEDRPHRLIVLMIHHNLPLWFVARLATCRTDR